MLGTSASGITIQTRGGLGNQLFQFALAVALSDVQRVPIFLDTSWHKASSDRPLELNEIDLRGLSLTDKITRTEDLTLRAIAKFPERLRIWLEGRIGVVNEQGLTFDPRILNVQPGVLIRGYFQSWKYFVEVNELVCSSIRSPIQTSDWFCKQSNRLNELGPWIGIHVRRGDYLTPAAMSQHGVLGDEYYKNACSAIRGITGELPVVVFSDDEPAARRLLSPVVDEAIWFNAPADSSSLENLLLMANASHLVTANSTFSWWAGWLNDRPKRTVVAPAPWFARDPTLSVDLIPPHWLSVPTRTVRS